MNAYTDRLDREAREDEDYGRDLEREKRDRQLEQGGLDFEPTKKCPHCNVLPKELIPGLWICACSLPYGTTL